MNHKFLYLNENYSHLRCSIIIIIEFMKINILLKLTLLSAIALSCTSSKSSDDFEEILSIKATVNNSQTLLASDYFDEISYVPLETSDDYLLGYVGRMIVENNSIYLMSGKSIYVFDLNTGKGTLNLSKLGNASGEYKSLFDFIVDKKSGNLELLDNNDRKIYIYDSEGNFLSTHNLPFMPFSFYKKEQNMYSFYNSNLESKISSAKIVEYDLEHQEKGREYFPINKKMAEYFFLGDEKIFDYSSKGVYCHISPVDTIYKYEEDLGFIPVLHLDFGKNAPPPSFYKNRYADIMEFSEAAKKNDYIYALSNFALNGQDDILFSYRLGKTFFWTLRFGKNEECTIDALHDDFNFAKAYHLTYHNSIYSLDDDYLYFLISSEQFVNLLDDGTKTPVVETLVNNTQITEESNPIVVKCKLKKSLKAI